nr:MAG TPA: hypothetical protein [Caudoviricetes sp.]
MHPLNTPLFMFLCGVFKRKTYLKSNVKLEYF